MRRKTYRLCERATKAGNLRQIFYIEDVVPLHHYDLQKNPRLPIKLN